MLRSGVEAAAWVVASTVAAAIAEEWLSPGLQDHVLFVKVLSTDLECGAFNSEGFEAKRAIERLGCDLVERYG